MYCENCGAKISDGKKFCKECGAPAPLPDDPAEDLNENKQIDNESLQNNEHFKNDTMVQNKTVYANTAKQQTSPVNNSQKSGYYNESPVISSKKDNIEKTKSSKIVVAIILLVSLSIIVLILINSLGDNNTRHFNFTAETTIETTTETTTIPSHQLYLDISSATNIFFSTYDIEIFLDDEKLGNISNGKGFTSINTVEQGEYQVRFYKNGDHSISATETVNVKQDSTFKCTLNSKSDSIIVTNVQLITSIVGAEIEVENVTNMNLSEAIAILKTKGFININSISTDNSMILSESNWTVINQSVEAGKIVDKNTEITLTCKKSSSYVSENFDGLTYNEAVKKAKEIGFSATYYNALSKKDISEQLSKATENTQKLWVVKESSAAESSSKSIKLYLIYTGNRKVPNVTNLNLTEALNQMKSSFFSNVNYVSNNGKMIFDTSNWTVVSQSVKAGEQYKADSEIILTCKSNVEPGTTASPTSTTKPANSAATKSESKLTEKTTSKSTKSTATTTEKSTMFYSTNDLETARKGKSGVFAYRQKGKNYSNYLIIDFDNGVLYFFSDDEISATRYKILSGDLNTQLEFYLPGESGINWVHFKYKNQPDRLYFGTENTLIADDFYTTDLNDALRLLNNRNIT